jgi:hypothetical protein
MATSWNKGIPMREDTKLKRKETFMAKRLLLPTEKPCIKCGEVKTLESFTRKKDNADGRLNTCKVCERERKSKYKPNPEKSRQYYLKHEFGITVEEYNNLFESQNGCCAICNDPPTGNRNLAVDHCHSNGNIRGLLCFRCNATLGKFNDDIELFQKAINYLSVKKPAHGGLLTSLIKT